MSNVGVYIQREYVRSPHEIDGYNFIKRFIIINGCYWWVLGRAQIMFHKHFNIHKVFPEKEKKNSQCFKHIFKKL